VRCGMAILFAMMTTIEHVRRNKSAPQPVLTARQLYLMLREQSDREQARAFIMRAIEEVAELPCDLPDDCAAWPQWVVSRNQEAENQHQRYQDSRRAGAPRRHFATRPAARRFLSYAAPALMVEGAWLYGVLRHWDLEAVQPLVRIYLEYIGKGIPDWNRVLRVRQLLTTQGCVNWQDQEDELFAQGALRLALSCCGDELLPELLGYQLGVAAEPQYRHSVVEELRELGISCYLLAPPAAADDATVACINDMLPLMQDRADFLRRVRNGYRLHGLGAEPVEAARDDTADINAAMVALPIPEFESAAPAEPATRPHDHEPRAVIRHDVPVDEHAWESIDNELGLLEARVASCETREEAVHLLVREISPSQHHQPLGLMAARLFTQLYA